MLDKVESRTKSPGKSKGSIPSLRNVNEYVTCPICHGYLIGASTITECLHTFCRSCIVKYLEESCTCPVCDTLIHQSHPLWYVSFDRTIQDIVYKLVPNLQQRELTREEAFYEEHELPLPERSNNGGFTDVNHKREIGLEEEGQDGGGAETVNYHEDEEQVKLELESQCADELAQLKRQYLMLSSHATIRHVKRYLAQYVLHDEEKYDEIDILCKDELLGRDHTLKFIYLTRWRTEQDTIMKLEYRTRIFR